MVPPVVPLTLVLGPEELLVDRAVGAATGAARAGLGDDVDVRELPAAGTTAATLRELLSPSLFGSGTVIVLRGVQDAGEELATELAAVVAAPAPDVVLVLAHNGKPGAGGKGKRLLDAVRKAGAAEVACAEVKTRRDKLRFLAAEIRRHGRKTTDDALETLLDAVGGDLRSLAAACSQLASDTEGVIEVEVVRRYYAGMAEVSGFTVADQALEGKTAEALARLRWALQAGTDPVPVVAALAMGLRNVVRVASAPQGLHPQDLARTLGMPSWKVDVVRRQARGWSASAAATALAAVAEADAQVKGAGTDPVYALEKAVITIARARNDVG